MKPRSVTVVVKTPQSLQHSALWILSLRWPIAITDRRRCERLVEWREKIAQEKRGRMPRKSIGVEVFPAW